MATMLEQAEIVTAGLVPDPMLPVPYRVQRVRQETDDTFTLEILPEDSSNGFSFAPGQFNMLYVFGVGEVPISISSDPDDLPLLKHTTRRGRHGHQGHAAAEARRDDGDSRAFRESLAGRRSDRPRCRDCGGRNRAGSLATCALPPNGRAAESSQDRSVVWHPHSRGHLYRHELEQWRGKFDLEIEVTVDRAASSWRGNVGVVTTMIPRAPFDPSNTFAIICGRPRS